LLGFRFYCSNASKEAKIIPWKNLSGRSVALLGGHERRLPEGN